MKYQKLKKWQTKFKMKTKQMCLNLKQSKESNGWQSYLSRWLLELQQADLSLKLQQMKQLQVTFFPMMLKCKIASK